MARDGGNPAAAHRIERIGGYLPYNISMNGGKVSAKPTASSTKATMLTRVIAHAFPV
jgi:hypothetical protein